MELKVYRQTISIVIDCWMIKKWLLVEIQAIICIAIFCLQFKKINFIIIITATLFVPHIYIQKNIYNDLPRIVSSTDLFKSLSCFSNFICSSLYKLLPPTPLQLKERNNVNKTNRTTLLSIGTWSIPLHQKINGCVVNYIHTWIIFSWLFWIEKQNQNWKHNKFSFTTNSF